MLLLRTFFQVIDPSNHLCQFQRHIKESVLNLLSLHVGVGGQLQVIEHIPRAPEIATEIDL